MTETDKQQVIFQMQRWAEIMACRAAREEALTREVARINEQLDRLLLMVKDL